MKIKDIGGYLDGGTIKIVTDKEIIFIDYRIGTETKGFFYDSYPDDKEAKIIEKTPELIEGLTNAINNYYDTYTGGFNFRQAILDKTGL